MQAFGKSATESASPTGASAKKSGGDAAVVEEDTLKLSFFGKVKAFLGENRPPYLPVSSLISRNFLARLPSRF